MLDLRDPSLQKYIISYIQESGGIDRALYKLQVLEVEILQQLRRFSLNVIVRAAKQMFPDIRLPQGLLSLSDNAAIDTSSITETDIIEVGRQRSTDALIESIPREVFGLLGQLMNIFFSKTLLYIPQQVASRMKLEFEPAGSKTIEAIEGISREVMSSSPLMLADRVIPPGPTTLVSPPALTGAALQRETEVAAVAVGVALEERDGTVIKKGVVAGIRRFFGEAVKWVRRRES